MWISQQTDPVGWLCRHCVTVFALNVVTIITLKVGGSRVCAASPFHDLSKGFRYIGPEPLGWEKGITPNKNQHGDAINEHPYHQMWPAGMASRRTRFLGPLSTLYKPSNGWEPIVTTLQKQRGSRGMYGWWMHESNTTTPPLFHLHIPKCAGTTIRSANGAMNANHMTARSITYHFANEYTEFASDNRTPDFWAVVRHPLARYISGFYHDWYVSQVVIKKAMAKNLVPEYEKKVAAGDEVAVEIATPTIEQMVAHLEHVIAVLKEWQQSGKHRKLNADIWWWQPQVNYIFDTDFRLATSHLYSYESINDRTPTLKQNYAALTDITELKPLMQSKHSNTHHHSFFASPKWCEFIDTPIAKLVEELYAPDYIVFGAIYKPYTCMPELIKS
eukprot:m.1804 g.1804  ORF g.1804 m.1804 type:complete len:388 (+) comp984_c0_seq2:178-1341(+)